LAPSAKRRRGEGAGDYECGERRRRPEATGSDAHSDKRPMTGGPQTDLADPQADAVATAVPGARPGTRPAALNTAGTTEARPTSRQQVHRAASHPPRHPALDEHI
jgi:hypothetical protein